LLTTESTEHVSFQEQTFSTWSDAESVRNTLNTLNWNIQINLLVYLYIILKNFFLRNLYISVVKYKKVGSAPLGGTKPYF